MSKKLLAIGLFMMASPLFAQELYSFNDIIDVLSVGKSVSAVIVSKHCTVNDPNEHKFPIPNAVVKVDSAVFREDKLGFDVEKYARPIPGFAPNGMMQRVSFILNKDGKFDAELASFDALTNSKVRKDITLNCDLGTGVRFYQQ